MESVRQHLEAFLRYVADMPRFAVAGIAGGLVVLAFGGGAYAVYVQKTAATTSAHPATTTTATATASPLPAAASNPASPLAAASPAAGSPPPSAVLYQPPTASAARVATLPPLQAGTCRLPMAYVSEANGGFVLYPGGQYLPDGASNVALPGNTPGQVGVNYGLTYDYEIGVWVPVPYHWLAPGGQTYVYQDYKSGMIRAVNVANGTSGAVTPGGGMQLIGVIDSGVYAASAPNSAGAYFVPFGGQPQQLVDHGTWDRYDRGALWGRDASNKLVRHHLSTGAETTWGSVTSASFVMGFAASGEPIVLTGGALALRHHDGSTTTVWPGTNGLIATGYAWGDSHGIWFEVDGSSGIPGASGSGTYLWSPTGKATRVSDEPAVHVMGPCV